MKLTQPGPFKIDEKRFGIPATLSGDCPKCRKPFVRAFDTQYISYPKVNTPIKVDLYCHECEHEWPIQMQINVSLSLVDEKV
jgi:uncharacterized protein YbaR (Trm112 family)